MIEKPKLTRMGLALSLGAILLLPAAGETQPSNFHGCDVRDAVCMDELVGASCLQALPNERQPCIDILADLERRLSPAEPVVMAQAAFAHSMLAQYPASDADAAAHRAAAEQLLLEVIAIDPSYTDAYIGLSGLADTPEEQARWLRPAVAASDFDSLASRFLASALDRHGTYESQLEAADVMRSAYEHADSGRHKWYLARIVESRYRELGLHAEAQDFLDRFSADFGLQMRLDEIQDAASAPDRALETLAWLCSQDVFRLLGANGCRDGTARLVGVIERVGDASLAERLARGMLEEIMYLPNEPHEASWAPDMVPWLERLLAAGVVSSELYSALGRCRLALDQRAAALDAFERARSSPQADDATRLERERIDEHIRILRQGRMPDYYRESCPTRVILVD